MITKYLGCRLIPTISHPKYLIASDSSLKTIISRGSIFTLLRLSLMKCTVYNCAAGLAVRSLLAINLQYFMHILNTSFHIWMDIYMYIRKYNLHLVWNQTAIFDICDIYTDIICFFHQNINNLASKHLPWTIFSDTFTHIRSIDSFWSEHVCNDW